MSKPVYLLGLMALASVATAWLPTDGTRRIVNRDGVSLFDAPAASHSKDKRTLPSAKIRGVNLGTLFVYEPWIASNYWQNTMKCTGSGYNSEFDCMSLLGQDAGNAKFQAHWASFVNGTDFDQMVAYGLNTVRIPIGYWMDESIVYWDSEHFPKGGLAALRNVCQLAASRGLYVILDLHGAPGAQTTNADTGQLNPNPGFYQDYQFNRAVTFLGWLRQQIHNYPEFSTVGMIEVANEPLQVQDGRTDYMRNTLYPNAYAAIRKAESDLNIPQAQWVHVQFMNQQWGAGDPKQYLTNQLFAAYDDHRYIKWDPSVTDISHDGYLRESCHDNRSGPDSPTIVGEFSLSVPDDVEKDAYWDPNQNTAFYKQWFAAQVMSYEKYTQGWVFWTWKTEWGNSDYRWSYQDAVAKGVIPKNLNTIATSGACNGY